MESIIHDFGINPILLAAQIVNFLVLLFILKKFLYKPILKVLDERKLRIAESLKNAEEIEKKLNEITERKEKEILKAAKEGEKIIKDATQASVQIIDDGKRKYEEIIKKALEDAKKFSQMEKMRLQEEIRENLATIVALALEKVVGKAINKTDQKKMIEDTVRRM